MTGSPLLRIYLQDHYAAATAGRALARRTADGQQDTPAGPQLATLAEQIAEDRTSLRTVMSALDVTPDRVKTAAALSAERLGRLKLNGSVLRRSPLSNVVELEAMLMAVRGKAAGWQTLRGLADTDPRLDASRLDELLAHAEEQARTLHELHRRVTAETFGTGR